MCYLHLEAPQESSSMKFSTGCGTGDCLVPWVWYESAAEQISPTGGYGYKTQM